MEVMVREDMCGKRGPHTRTKGGGVSSRLYNQYIRMIVVEGDETHRLSPS